MRNDTNVACRSHIIYSTCSISDSWTLSCKHFLNTAIRHSSFVAQLPQKMTKVNDNLSLLDILHI
ncbi:hypothetical protein BOCO_1054 [Bombiscardovia coagulans]|uniref:Uncharacterized protein n=1 Tax=Bombiscardovia coagulans TaxID=686666 RepID=A0A261EQX7_9BIFI|nr:hypothetical protein BOCO_1054 [Bombiscardovia coagulans]